MTRDDDDDFTVDRESGDMVSRDDKQLELFEKAFSHTEGLTLEDLAFQMGEEFGGGSIKKAMQIAALMACCDVIAQDISKATLRYRERQTNGTSRVVVPSPRKNDIAELLALDANRFMTWREAIEMMVYWSCFTDNAYGGIIRNIDGTVSELIPFQTGRVRMKVVGNELFYDVTASTLYEQALLGSSSRTFAARDMMHVRTRLLDGMEGYGAIDAGKKTIDGLRAIKEYSQNLFTEDGLMRGVFTTSNEGVMPEEAFQRLRSQMRELMNKFRKLTSPIVLEHGLQFNQMSAKPNDIELTKQFEAAVNEVCRLFRMPPHKIFLMTGSKYENLETQEKMYVGDTLIPRALSFEDQFARTFQDRKQRLKNFFEFDRSEMTLRDTKLETERTVQGLERGALEIDEARAVFGLNPLPNGAGKTRLIPVNMTLVDEKNNVVVGASPSSGDTATDTPDPDADVEDDAEKQSNGTVLRLVEK